jgi:hypothetical protein
VRFLDGKAELCEVVGSDADGVTLRLDGLPRPVKFPWWQLAAEDASRLRGLKPAPAGDAAGELSVPGVRIRTLDGKFHEGIDETGAPPGKRLIRSADGRLAVPLESIVSEEAIRIELVRAFGAEEAFSILMARQSPKTAEDYERFGALLRRAKLEERSRTAFRTAEALRHPERPEARVAGVLIRMRERLDDVAIRKALLAVEDRASAGDHDAALEALEALEKLLAGRPEALEELRRARAELQLLRGRAREHRILEEGWRAIDVHLKSRVLDRTLTLAAARAWALERLHEEMLDQLRRKFNFSPGDPALESIWSGRPDAALQKHAYDAATWLVAKPGLRPEEAWWIAADDASRFALLKGLYVEKHLQVRRVEEKSCSLCGGLGLVEAVPDPAPQVCPSCQGLKVSRVLIYR